MTFETHYVETAPLRGRNPDRVADTINNIYEDIARRKGKVVTALVLADFRQTGEGSDSLLYFVAELPDADEA